MLQDSIFIKMLKPGVIKQTYAFFFLAKFSAVSMSYGTACKHRHKHQSKCQINSKSFHSLASIKEFSIKNTKPDIPFCKAFLFVFFLETF